MSAQAALSYERMVFTMAFCPQCGAPFNDGATSCPQCGAPLASAPAPQPAPAPADYQFQQQYQQPQYQQPQFQQQYQQPVYQPVVDPLDHTAEFDPKDISDNKVVAMLPYLMGIVGVAIAALIGATNSEYVKFHIRQSLKLTVCNTLAPFLAIVPILGWIAAPIVIGIIAVVQLICFFRVCKGKAKEAPIVCKFGFLK